MLSSMLAALSALLWTGARVLVAHSVVTHDFLLASSDFALLDAVACSMMAVNNGMLLFSHTVRAQYAERYGAFPEDLATLVDFGWTVAATVLMATLLFWLHASQDRRHSTYALVVVAAVMVCVLCICGVCVAQQDSTTAVVQWLDVATVAGVAGAVFTLARCIPLVVTQRVPHPEWTTVAVRLEMAGAVAALARTGLHFPALLLLGAVGVAVLSCTVAASVRTHLSRRYRERRSLSGRWLFHTAQPAPLPVSDNTAKKHRVAAVYGLVE